MLEMLKLQVTLISIFYKLRYTNSWHEKQKFYLNSVHCIALNIMKLEQYMY